MNTQHFEVDANWIDHGSSTTADLAEISIRLGNHVLTRVADLELKRTRDFFRASATSLALWLADNWWRLRSEPIDDPRLPSTDWRLRHELSSAPGGTLWPPLMIYSVGERIVISPGTGRRPAGEPVQYLDTPVGLMSANEYEVGVDQFFDRVVTSCARAPDIAALKTLLQQLGVERRDHELSAWRRLEACLGYDADEAPDGVIDALVDMEGLVGEEGVEEAAIAFQGNTSPKALHDAVEASRASNLVVSFDLSNHVQIETDLYARVSPWRLAEEAAAQVREAIGRPRGPLLGKLLAEMLRVRWETLKEATATARDLPYAARLRGDTEHQHVAAQTRRPKDRRFELSRMLGDAIWTRDASFGVVSRARTDRQKFQRAFAQSLLCPFSDLRNHIDFDKPKIEQIEAAAHYFHVHPNVVRNLLVYKGVLPRETLEEHLEAA